MANSEWNRSTPATRSGTSWPSMRAPSTTPIPSILMMSHSRTDASSSGSLRMLTSLATLTTTCWVKRPSATALSIRLTVSFMLATSIGQPIKSIRCMVSLGQVTVIEGQRAVSPGLGPAAVIDAVGEPAGLLIDEQARFRHIHQFNRPLNHLVAQGLIGNTPADFQQGKYRLGKAVH